MHLFINKPQKTSKCDKNISDTLGYYLVCHIFVLTTFWCHLWSITEQTQDKMESIFSFSNRKAFFISKSIIPRKSAFAHFGDHKNKLFDVIFWLYKMKQSHWCLCVAKNCDWSRKVTPQSNIENRFSWNENLQQNWTELNCETYKT